VLPREGNAHQNNRGRELSDSEKLADKVGILRGMIERERGGRSCEQDSKEGVCQSIPVLPTFTTSN